MLLLKESDDHVEPPDDHDIAIKMTDTTLSWVDPESLPNATSSENGVHAERQYGPDGNSANTSGSSDYGPRLERDDVRQVDRLLWDSDVNKSLPCALRNINLTVEKVCQKLFQKINCQIKIIICSGASSVKQDYANVKLEIN